MKFFVFAAAIAAVSAVPALVNTGKSDVSRSDDGHGNYQFGYNEDHATGGTFRKEQGGPGYMTGSYGLRDADGRVRTVNYVADAHGYRASVSTNEPGTDVKQDPAAADFNYDGAGYSSPILAAPIVSNIENHANLEGYGNYGGLSSIGNLEGAGKLQGGYGGLSSIGNLEGVGKLQGGYGGLSSIGNLEGAGKLQGGYGGLSSIGNLEGAGKLQGGYGGLSSIGNLEGAGRLQGGYGGLEGYDNTLNAQAYNTPLLNNDYSDAHSAGVAFPSSYSVETQHTSIAPAAIDYQSAGVALAGNEYSGYNGELSGALTGLGHDAYNGLNKY